MLKYPLHYSGERSRKFWRDVLRHDDTNLSVYDLALVLQEAEVRVLRIVNAETKRQSKRKAAAK